MRGLGLLLLSACGYIPEDERAWRWDLDGDGIERPRDCDDGDADHRLPTAWYLDADGDLYGAGEAVVACEPPDDHVADGGDCDDERRLAHPGAEEVCNGLDDDCDGQRDEGVDIPSFYPDLDGDGFGDALGPGVSACEAPAGHVADASDCDDADPEVRPGAAEPFDGVDNDCDGLLDCDDPDLDEASATFWPDGDGDGFGDAGVLPVLTCDPPEGWVLDGTDCDDGDPLTNPEHLWFADADGDGYGWVGASTAACEAPAGHVANANDCDDADAAVMLLALEVCDGIDNNCDGLIDDDQDERFVADAVRYHRDSDGDGFGDPVDFVEKCSPPAGYVPDGNDCRDDDPTRHPEAAEVCNQVDDDCDGLVDDADDDLDPASGTVWYFDTDGDGFGDPSAPAAPACLRPPGTVDLALGADCDDGDADVFPGAPELCDGRDNDCNAVADDGAPDWYPDLDGDGFGDDGAAPVAVATCAAPGPDVSYRRGDCDDARADVQPGAAELCDGIDNDCDGAVDADDDEGLDFATWYLDGDGDGAGDDDQAVVACDAPPNYVATAGDCDDGDPAIHPSAVEVCGGSDEDCDGLVDEDDPSVADALTWYPDGDLDGYGTDAGAVVACEAPFAHAGVAGDCDDGDPAVWPGAREVCSGADEDCDGLVDGADPDLDPTSGTWFYVDGDADGYGGAPGARQCEAPAGQVAASGDCDDGAADVFPGAPELCDGADNDCDGVADQVLPSWWPDADGDGFGDDLTAPVVDCVRPGGAVGRAGDCDDASGAVHPEAAEICDGVDNDCDGLTDGADAGVTGDTWYVDGDGDGFGNPSTGRAACPGEVGPADVLDGTDCNDGDAATFPGATEVCNARDDDCDGWTDDADPGGVSGALDWYGDGDGDGYGTAAAHSTACLQPLGSVAAPGDCDDTEFKVHPGATETCDGADDDCDGQVDEGVCATTGDTGVGCPVVAWREDPDGDGFADSAAAPIQACDPPAAGWTDRVGDCGEGDASVSPLGVEVCDAADTDEDCDGAVDDLDPDVAGPFLTLCRDADADGLGDPMVETRRCDVPSGWVAECSDCDDGDASVGACAGTGDTGAPCSGAPEVSLALDRVAGEAGVTLFTATATVTGGSGGAVVRFGWGDGAPATSWSSVATADHVFAASGVYDVTVEADDGCATVWDRVPVVVAPAGQVIEVTTGLPETDAETWPPAPLGTGVSLHEALVLAEGLAGLQVVTVADGLTSLAVDTTLPALADPAGTWVVGGPGVSVDGSLGGVLRLDGPDLVVAHLEISGFVDPLWGAVHVDTGGVGARVLSCAFDANPLALRVDGTGTEVRGSTFDGNGAGSGVQVDLRAATTFLDNRVAGGPGGGVLVRQDGDGTRIALNVVRDHGTWGIQVPANGVAAADDVSITDNTVLGNVGTAVQIGGAGAERVDFRNNVLAGNGGFGLEAEPANFVGGALDHNLWFGNGAGDCSACVPGPSAVLADPLLDGVMPLPGSPCIDAGAITGVDRNGPLLGTASGAGADIGAVETP